MGIYLIIILLISSIKTQEIDDIESKALQKYLNQTNEPVNLSNKLEDKCERLRNLKRVSERKDVEVFNRQLKKISNQKWIENNPEKAKECIRINNQKWRKKNPENVREYNRIRQKEWREKNPEKARDYHRRWRKRNLERERERDRIRYQKQRDQPRIGLHHIVTETTNDPDTTSIESTTNDSDTTSIESTTTDSDTTSIESTTTDSDTTTIEWTTTDSWVLVS